MLTSPNARRGWLGRGACRQRRRKAAMCAIDDAEPSDLWHCTRQRSRKARKCCECQRAIGVGEMYQRDVFLYAGRWDWFETCVRCADGPCKWLTDRCGGYLVGDAEADLRDHYNEADGMTRAELFA